AQLCKKAGHAWAWRSVFQPSNSLQFTVLPMPGSRINKAHPPIDNTTAQIATKRVINVSIGVFLIGFTGFQAFNRLEF
ncbi:MAG: hypothetical protein OES26_27570, partial [Gammaproteobacteria bacterium]|nr:hypothetical protein [Gammaproteobacteria bacterium]